MAGTRGGVGRITAMVVGLAVLSVLALADSARAGTYNVAQCGWGVGVELDRSKPRTEGAAAYLRPGFCTGPSVEYPGLAFDLGYAFDGEQGIARARWAAPPGTSFVAAGFTWSGTLAVAVWQVAGIEDERGFEAIAFDLGTIPPRYIARNFGTPVPNFEVRLACLLLGPDGCVRSVPSSMWLKELTLTVADPVAPRARLGATLAASGWHRGTVPLELTAEDPAGAGVDRLGATIDGAPVLAASTACAVATIEGEVRATRLRPCPPTAAQASEVDTTKLADGVHALRGCAVDFGGAGGCAPVMPIQVDNSPPAVDFTTAPRGQAAVSVSDAFSGPAAGTISVRRAGSEIWTDLPTTVEPAGAGTATLRAKLPELGHGAFFFRATAIDGAGNGGSAQLRAAGSAAQVRRQVARGGGRRAAAQGRATHLVAYLTNGRRRTKRHGRSGRRLTIHHGTRRAKRHAATGRLTVHYGVAAEVRGRLLDAGGDGIAGRRVAVLARTAGGAGGAAERGRAVTDANGRFALRLSPGTSRRVLVSFHGGGGFAPAHHRPLTLRVHAAVSLAAEPPRLRAGQTVTLSGRVRHDAARIPTGGKLVTIQYLERASGRWRPALVVRTGARGAFNAHYRFRYITGAARIRLRATALPEAGWPYASGSSKPVTVEVHGG